MSIHLVLALMPMSKLQGRGIFLYDLRRALNKLITEKSIPEKRVLYCMYVVSLPGLPGSMQTDHDQSRPHKKDTWD